MSAEPAVTVLMPVYNGGAHLAPAMASILKQSFEDFEFLVINDGSRDASREIVLSFRDPRIRLLDNPGNLGLIASLNRGLAAARGRYLARMDADDLSLPQRLARQYEVLENRPEVGLCASAVQVISDSPPKRVWWVPTGHALIKAHLLFRSALPHPTFMLRRSVLEEHGIAYSQEYPHAEDYALLCALSRVCRLAGVSQPLLRYRQHAGSSSLRHGREQREVSDRVREGLLRDLDLEPTPEELALHNQLGNADYGAAAADLEEVEAWLAKLRRAVAKGEDYSPEALDLVIKNLWLDLCLTLPPVHGAAGMGRYFRGPLFRPRLRQPAWALRMAGAYLYHRLAGTR